MRRSTFDKCVLGICLVAGTIGAGCSSNGVASLAGPSGIGAVAASTTVSASRALAGSVTNGMQLTAVRGEGRGTFNDTPTASDDGGTLNAQLNINVHGVSPNVVQYLRRAGDLGQAADGICQNAAAGIFLPVPVAPGGPVATLETSAGGAGTLHLELHAGLPDGAGIDAMYQLVDVLPPGVPTIDLRTPCFTFVVK